MTLRMDVTELNLLLVKCKGVYVELDRNDAVTQV